MRFCYLDGCHLLACFGQDQSLITNLKDGSMMSNSLFKLIIRSYLPLGWLESIEMVDLCCHPALTQLNVVDSDTKLINR